MKKNTVWIKAWKATGQEFKVFGYETFIHVPNLIVFDEKGTIATEDQSEVIVRLDEDADSSATTSSQIAPVGSNITTTRGS